LRIRPPPLVPLCFLGGFDRLSWLFDQPCSATRRRSWRSPPEVSSEHALIFSRTVLATIPFAPGFGRFGESTFLHHLLPTFFPLLYMSVSSFSDRFSLCLSCASRLIFFTGSFFFVYRGLPLGFPHRPFRKKAPPFSVPPSFHRACYSHFFVVISAARALGTRLADFFPMRVL